MTEKDLVFYQYADVLKDAVSEEIVNLRSYYSDSETICKLIRILENRIVWIESKKETIKTEMDSIQDPEIKQIIKYRFKGYTWYQVNLKVYGYPSADYSRKRLSRFIERFNHDRRC